MVYKSTTTQYFHKEMIELLRNVSSWYYLQAFSVDHEVAPFSRKFDNKLSSVTEIDANSDSKNGTAMFLNAENYFPLDSFCKVQKIILNDGCDVSLTTCTR